MYTADESRILRRETRFFAILTASGIPFFSRPRAFLYTRKEILRDVEYDAVLEGVQIGGPYWVSVELAWELFLRLVESRFGGEQCFGCNYEISPALANLR